MRIFMRVRNSEGGLEYGTQGAGCLVDVTPDANGDVRIGQLIKDQDWIIAPGDTIEFLEEGP